MIIPGMCLAVTRRSLHHHVNKGFWLALGSDVKTYQSTKKSSHSRTNTHSSFSDLGISKKRKSKLY